LESLLGSPIGRSLAPSPVPISTIASLAPLVSLLPPPSQEPIYSSIPNPFLKIQLNSNSNPLSNEPLLEEE
jgi:hypothetical protein